MKDKLLAVDAFSHNARISENALKYIAVEKHMANSNFSNVSEATDEA